MNLSEIMAKYAENVRELRFGNKIKLIKVAPSKYRGEECWGWMLLVEGVAGGFMMNMTDGFLYRDVSGTDLFRDPNFYSRDLEDAIRQAEALLENIGETGTVVSPSDGFISKFLNPTSFEKLKEVWDEDGLKIVNR